MYLKKGFLWLKLKILFYENNRKIVSKEIYYICIGALDIKKIHRKEDTLHLLLHFVGKFSYSVLTFGSVVGRKTRGVTFLMGMPS